MNIRPFALLALLALLPTAPSRARIVIDDEAPEPGPEKPGIHVPGPNDAEGGPRSQSTPVEDTLSFLNKDQLHGILLGIDPDTGLHWRSPEARATIDFKTSQISQIRLGSHKAPNTPQSAQLIVLTNGDVLPGNIVSLDDKTLLLDTWYAGHLTIPHSMVRRITPLSNANSPIYEGPAGMDGWVVGRVGASRSWSFRDGALIGSNYGTVGRDVKLPDLADIQFDVVLRGNNQFSIGIYSDRADNFGNCYVLQLSTGYTELQRNSRTGSTDLGGTQLQNIMRHDKSHIELRASKQKKSIWLLIDGRMVKEWSDPAEFNGDGGSIIFACQLGTVVKVSNIKVSKWDGKFDDSSAAANTNDDCVQLVNGDKVTGLLESIQDGNAKFSSSYAELNIPLERIGQIDLASAHSKQAKAGVSDVRAFLPEGGVITLQLTQWDQKGCIGSSPNFGKANFSPDAFARILFNLPAQPNQDSEDSEPDSSSPDQSDHN